MAAALALLLGLGDLAASQPSRTAVTRRVFLMGTLATLTVLAPGRPAGIDALESSVRVLEETEAELSTWRGDSALGRLNRRRPNVPFPLAPALCRLFKDLAGWHDATGGAFDPGVGPLLEAWGVGKEGRIPGPEALALARARSGFGRFRLDRGTCSILRPAGGRLDSGAFGKGEALDRVLDAPAGRALPWLIDLGGQVMVSAPPPGLPGWTVALAHPERRNQAEIQVVLASGSLSTSGGSERDTRAGGRRIGHILDPRTGQPAPFAGSVTVWHERALAADILSTALYVMGPDEGLAWAEARGVAACFLIPAGGRVLQRATSRFDRAFGGLHRPSAP